MSKIEWKGSDWEQPEGPDEDWCDCDETTGWMLHIEEGHASLHHSCGKESWLSAHDYVDLWMELPVTVEVHVQRRADDIDVEATINPA